MPTTLLSIIGLIISSLWILNLKTLYFLNYHSKDLNSPCKSQCRKLFNSIKSFGKEGKNISQDETPAMENVFPVKINIYLKVIGKSFTACGN